MIKYLYVVFLLYLVLLWDNFLTRLFQGSLADIIGVFIMLVIALSFGLIYLFIEKSIKNILGKIVVYFLIILLQLLIHPFFHYSYPQPYEALAIINKHLQNYDSIEYADIYEEHDLILEQIALYKFEKLLPEKRFSIHYSIPKPTVQCPGCADDLWFNMEYNGIEWTTSEKSIVSKISGDSVLFEGNYKGHDFRFFYHDGSMKNYLYLDKEYRVNSFELNYNRRRYFIDYLRMYLSYCDYKQVSDK